VKPLRSIPLVISVSLALFLVGGGLTMKVGAGDNSFPEARVFSEVLSLVLDHYVDPLEADKLLHGAYEGLLGGLDAHGAYLTPEELTEWKSFDPSDLADPGLSVLQAGRVLQIVAVAPGSPAEEAGVEAGDQIRGIDGRAVRELSLDQTWRLIQGVEGSTVRLDLTRASDGFRREEVELVRSPSKSRSYDLAVERGIGVLHILDMRRLPADEIAEELDDVRSRGVASLLIDLRNVADVDPRAVAAAGGLLSTGSLLRLKDRQGSVVESVSAGRREAVWTGSVAALVNGATAGSAEALASLIQEDLGGLVLGEPTYGLGSEPKLYEMEDGSGVLVSAMLWETAAGRRWNGGGVEPDEVIRGSGGDYDARMADQLEQALQSIERRIEAAKPDAAAA
jgi:carboxyl-terminal processing protease